MRTKRLLIAALLVGGVLVGPASAASAGFYQLSCVDLESGGHVIAFTNPLGGGNVLTPVLPGACPPMPTIQPGQPTR